MVWALQLSVVTETVLSTYLCWQYAYAGSNDDTHPAADDRGFSLRRRSRPSRAFGIARELMRPELMSSCAGGVLVTGPSDMHTSGAVYDAVVPWAVHRSARYIVDMRH